MLLPAESNAQAGEAGFSLVELLVAMLVATLVATGIVMNLDFDRGARREAAADTLVRLGEELRQDAMVQGRILALDAGDGAVRRLVWRGAKWAADGTAATVQIDGLRASTPRRKKDAALEPDLVAAPSGVLEGRGFLVDEARGQVRVRINAGSNQLERAG